MKIKITADSTCDLTKELVEKYGIEITPLYIIDGDKTYVDGVDIQPQEIFDLVTASGKLCSTAAVSVSDYLAVFGRLLKEYDAIVHFTISSDMSACYQNACIAASELGNVYVVDSRNLSTGIGHLVLDAAIMAQSGMDAADIKAALDKKQEKLDVSFILDTLKFIYKGGRCSAVAAFGANVLGLKPCIEVKSGAMGVGKKYRGTLKKCMVQYVHDRLEGRDDIDYSRIFITDSGVSDDIYEAVYEAVAQCGPFENIFHTRAGCTVSNHCGPNCLGILYYHK